jgi:dTDP-4-dehydrorhamnose 3,5-epimerase
MTKKKNYPQLINYFSSKDVRGEFCKIFDKKLFKKLNFKIKEINFSYNKKKGTLRGIHFQDVPKNEEKLVCCVKGKVFDIVVNIQKKSKNFLNCKSFNLDENKKQILYIPKGYAHGFQTLCDDCTLVYLHSENFSKRLDRGFHALSKDLKIKWPIKKKIMSKKDKNFKKFKFQGI